MENDSSTLLSDLPLSLKFAKLAMIKTPLKFRTKIKHGLVFTYICGSK